MCSTFTSFTFFLTAHAPMYNSFIFIPPTHLRSASNFVYIYQSLKNNYFQHAFQTLLEHFHKDFLLNVIFEWELQVTDVRSSSVHFKRLFGPVLSAEISVASFLFIAILAQMMLSGAKSLGNYSVLLFPRNFHILNRQSLAIIFNNPYFFLIALIYMYIYMCVQFLLFLLNIRYL